VKVQKDILTTDTGELLIADGDVVVGDAVVLHQLDIIVAHKGEWKQNPLTGAGIAQFLDDDETEELLRTVRKELTLDGMTVSKVSIVNEELQVSAAYE
jgi:glutathione synthase/RimK-type ligase-like ATP-grasp enzyme